jgi:arylsulfatase A-like enzyme
MKSPIPPAHRVSSAWAVLLAGWLGAAFSGDVIAATPASKPNVVFFLVDDMGWMDCGVYGSQYYETPHIDRFAQRAMRFTDAYALPLCSPTRATILTGKDAARHGMTTASGHQPPQPAGHNFLPEKAPPNRATITPESRNHLEPTEYTLAQALRDAGWRTAHIGKWHIGLTEPHWPQRFGFDVAVHAHPDPGPPSYFAPYGFRGHQSYPDGPPGEYITDRMTDEAIAFIEASRDRPFLLHLWHYGVHGPWGHKEEYTKRFAGRKDPRGRQENAIMASMLKSVDDSFGRVLETLDRLNLTNKTIIIFYSDNGGNVHSNTPEDSRAKAVGKLAEERIKDWRTWAGDLPPTNNFPLREGKASLYEGGVRVPLMWSWAGVIRPGSVSSEVVGAIDFYPTLLELLGVARPARQPLDGVSYAGVLRSSAKLSRDAYFTYFPHGGGKRLPGVTVRSGDWKLIRWFETSRDHPSRHELYNLRDDIGETNNLAARLPQRVKELDAKIDRFLADTGALYPRPNPAYRPGTVAPEQPAGKAATAAKRKKAG